MPVVHLTDRSLIRASGPETAKFLHGVITCNVLTMEDGDSRYGALLLPQGKIISDFLFYREGPESFLFDAPAERVQDLVKRLAFHRLRAKVDFKPLDDMAVAAVFGPAGALPDGVLYADPRLPELGGRLILPKAAAEGLGGDLAAYEAHRIALGIPKGGADFPYNDTFPHEADMDQLGGVDFKKGCYVGQEVVSRMEHRSTPRNRLVEAIFPAAAEAGIEIMAGEKSVEAAHYAMLHCGARGYVRHVANSPAALTRPQAHWRFDEVRLTADARVDDPTRVLAGLARTRVLAALQVAAEQVGGAAQCLQLAVDYTKERVQFGKPVASFQAIKHRTAEMMVRMETARSTVLGVAARVSQGEQGNGLDDAALAAEVAAARVQATEAYRYCAQEAIQLHGGVGFTWEYDPQMHFKRAQWASQWFGPSRDWREALAAHLLDAA